jgi:Patatin-like phospholipase
MLNPSVVGFSFSSGGLLLPYHLGVMDCLVHHRHLTPHTPIAGSSAGSIAVAAHACSIPSKRVLESTIRISDDCQELGGARGRLLPMLRARLADMISDEEHGAAVDRGNFCIAYRQVFPTNKAIHQTSFDTVEDLHDAVCHSSTFPFFVTHWPVAFDARTNRAFVDGFFAEPRNRMGCPDFAKTPDLWADRTVAVSVFPQELVGLTAFEAHDCICPQASDVDPVAQLTDLLRLATQPSSASELFQVYESGYRDAEQWCRREQQREQEVTHPTPSELRRVL